MSLTTWFAFFTALFALFSFCGLIMFMAKALSDSLKDSDSNSKDSNKEDSNIPLTKKYLAQDNLRG